MLFLRPLSLIYRGAVLTRNFLYDKSLLKAKKLPVPVVSVGNLSVGGSGKTSLVSFLVREFSKDHLTVVVLRGYRRKSKGLLVVSRWGEVMVSPREGGDEAYLLAKLLPEASVVVSEDRFEGGMYAVRELGAELVVLDDGFQHRRLHRDLDIVLLRKRDLSDKLLPEGRLREPLSSLERADAVVLSYQDIEPFEFSFGDKPVFKMFREFSSLLNADFKVLPLSVLEGKEVVAFAGLGSNEQFFEVLKRLGIKVKRFISLPDHYHYEDFPIEEGELYLTTPKDLVKLPKRDNLLALNFEVRVEGLVPFLRERLHL